MRVIIDPEEICLLHAINPSRQAAVIGTGSMWQPANRIR